MAIEYDPKADLYVTLRVEPNATTDRIKEAHRDLIRNIHPDRGGDPAQAATVNHARDVLSDPIQRRDYDNAKRAWLEQALSPSAMSAHADPAHANAPPPPYEAHANVQQSAGPPPVRLSEAERAARQARNWRWGVVADLVWPEVTDALRAGKWLPAIAKLGTALFFDRAVELECTAEQLAALDALLEQRQRERYDKVAHAILQAFSGKSGQTAPPQVGQPGVAAGTKSRAASSKRRTARRRSRQ